MPPYTESPVSFTMKYRKICNFTAMPFSTKVNDSPKGGVGLTFGTSRYGIVNHVINLVDWFTLVKKVAPPPPSPLTVGSKMRWTLDEETYRIAVQTKKGILQVKSVTDGAGECHDDGCKCIPCAELRMFAPPPWRIRERRPLKLTFFADEAAWTASLPEGGKIIHY